MARSRSLGTRRYSVRAATGVLGATLAADASVFTMRLAAAAVNKAYITRIQASFSATAAFTAASQQLFVAERFTTATPSGGTAMTPLKHLAAQGATEVTDIRAATTGLLTVTSVVFEGPQLPILGAASPAVSVTTHGLPLILEDDPIVLAAGEGLSIKNVVVWPAAGAGVLTAHVSWFEA